MSEIQTLREQLETLKRLNRNRFDYVLARSSCQDVSEALEEIGMSRAWYYKFSSEEREELERLAEELHIERKIQAELILGQAVNKAAQVKADGLDSKDSRIKQASATEILDRVLGKPTQRTELTGKDGGPVEVKNLSDEEKIQRLLVLVRKAGNDRPE